VEQPFQHDYAYDEHDNPIDFYLSYPEKPDLMHPSAAMPWIGRTYTNVYDDAGRLQQATQAAYGNGAGGMPGSVRHFSEDSQGRCSTITEDDGGKTVITYDGAGRVATIAASHPTWQRCSVSNA